MRVKPLCSNDLSNGVNGFHGVLLMFFIHDLHINLNMTSEGTEYALNECQGSFSTVAVVELFVLPHNIGR